GPKTPQRHSVRSLSRRRPWRQADQTGKPKGLPVYHRQLVARSTDIYWRESFNGCARQTCCRRNRACHRLKQKILSHLGPRPGCLHRKPHWRIILSLPFGHLTPNSSLCTLRIEETEGERSCKSI